MKNKEKQTLQKEISAITKLTEQVILETSKIDDEVAENLQSQISIEKGALGTKKDNAKVRARIHENSATIAVTNNEIGNLKMEMLNVSARIKRMREEVDGLDAEHKEKNSLIEKYEQEIRRRNDELSKKQKEMDLLNKKYDQLAGRHQVKCYIQISNLLIDFSG